MCAVAADIDLLMLCCCNSCCQCVCVVGGTIGVAVCVGGVAVVV